MVNVTSVLSVGVTVTLLVIRLVMPPLTVSIPKRDELSTSGVTVL